jgi:hypothetical protein
MSDDRALERTKQMLRTKIVTVSRERRAGRGDYDRLTAILAELRASLKQMESD